MNRVFVAVFIALSLCTYAHAGCVDTMSEISSLFISCPVPFFTDSDLTSSLDSFCSTTTDCSAYAYSDLLASLLDECGLDYVFDSIDPIIEAINLACLQVDGEYCTEAMYNLIFDSSLSYPFSEYDLELYCSPCISYYWSEFVSYASTTGEVDLYYSDVGPCMKDGDVWCALEVEALAAAYSINDYTSMAEISCRTTCIARYSTMNEYLDDSGWTSAFDVLCYQNEDGELCLPIAYDAITTSDVLNQCTSATLTDACTSSLTSLIDSTGCCYESLYNNLIDDSILTQLEDLIAQAGLTIPGPCSASDIPQVELYVDNLDYQYALDNWDEVSGYLMQDFTLNSGISQVYAELLNSTGSGVFVLLQGLSLSDLSSVNTYDALISILGNEGYSLYDTATSISSSARTDPLTSIVAGGAESAVSLVSADMWGASGTAVVSAFFVVVCAVATLLF